MSINNFEEAYYRTAEESGYTSTASEVNTRLRGDYLQLAQAGAGDVRMNQGSQSRLQSFGSIDSIDLPAGYSSVRPNADTGYLSMAEAPKLYQSNENKDAKLGFWNRDLGSGSSVTANLHKLFSETKPGQNLTDDQYFSISDMMAPGPWAGNGRGHEISMKTEKVNGRDAIVYDYWMGKDPTKDTPMSQMGPDDIRCRVVFVENGGKLDVMWMQASNREFARRSAEFDQSLKSIRWK